MTKLLYLEKQNLTEIQAKIINILETPKGTALILDQTVFYVQGGGQPGDLGLISNQNGIFEVTNTIKDEFGNVLHLGSFLGSKLKIGESVDLKIDEARRKLNSKIHSTGHLINLAVKNLKLSWIPIKGFHYPEGPYVEYEIQKNDSLHLEAIKQQLQKEYNNLVQKNLKVKISFDTTQTVKNQPLRLVSFAEFDACACGGTHVNSTKDLIGFEITKIKLKGSLVRIGYNRLTHI